MTASGAPLVKRVVRTRDLYAGEQLDALPDLLVEWNESCRERKHDRWAMARERG